ncbi:MAG: tyrosine-type recombinase/integrase, partial [Acutalibacteraceae bacterium]
DEKGFKPSSMEVVNTILHPIFDMAVRDDIIRKNPTQGVMLEIKSRRDWSKPKRLALTVEQQSVFIDFLANSKTYCHWIPLFTLFLGTGCRVGEIIGLRWEDCDFENSLISINHNLIYRPQDNGKCEFHITTPKTTAGIRLIPMFDEVKSVLLKEYEYQRLEGFNQTVIDGYSGFIFKNRFGSVYSPHSINRGIERICRDYNAEEIKRAEKEHRSPVLLPHFTVHNLRHTFCSRMCENESNMVNLKVIQEIMGHSSIDTTLDVYTDLTTKIKQDAFMSLQGKIKLS